MPRLVVQSPEFAGRAFELINSEITLGRLPDNTIHIDHGSVSGHHAVLTQEGDTYTVRDLNSTNGTRINGARITQQRLQRGDVLQAGNISLEYHSEATGDAQPLPEVRQGVDLAAGGESAVPIGFVNASPFGRKRLSTTPPAVRTATLVLGFLAVASLGFLVAKVFLPAS